MTYTTDKTYNPAGGAGRLIPPHGGYRKLASYRSATITFDFGAVFADRYFKPNKSYKTYGSYRSYDQLFQALRSGRQNIVEASAASGTSKKTELKLLGVARASLEEALADAEDFLRQQGLQIWNKDDPRAREIRALAYKTDRSYKTYETYLRSGESAANCLICLIRQTNYLLDRQLAALEKQFLEEGGFTEKLYQARQNWRSGKAVATLPGQR
jgi:four helix bundle suffix protein